ncbi:MAG TPA: hypothetical protein DIT64_12255 [Verrucomicrobiales bacterium]|nr:hypothetical protein [Verrucomicrobiales bacterium]
MPKSPEPTAGLARLERLYLGTACFCAGAAMMVIEISAARLLAPMFGNSIYTWTALIGVILISFSIGGYLGGRLADRRAGMEVLGWLLAVAAVLTFAIPALGALITPVLEGSGFIDGPIFYSLLVLAVPGALLGAVSPASVRLYSLTWKDTHVGGAAGTVSMLGSLGSFVGTFLSGFVLLGAFGVKSIFIGCALLLLLLALCAFALGRVLMKSGVRVVVAAVLAGGTSAVSKTPANESVIHERESYYHHIKVIETGAAPRRERRLQLDSTSEGGINPDTGALILDYQHFWRLAAMDGRKISSALFIGAGAFGMPCELSREHPGASVDVAELDPQVIEVGREFFNLDKHPKVRAHAGDARHFLRIRADNRWDMIFGDAYNGVHAIPPHLATREFFQLVSDRLSPDGVYLMNIISAVQGRHAELLGGMLSTLREVFPNVEVFAVHPGVRQTVQNIIIMASHQNRLESVTGRRHTSGSVAARLAASHIPARQAPASGVVFTDDFNPVDSIIARSLLR